MTQESASDTPVAELPPGTVYDLFREALPGVQMTAAQAGLDVAITVRREDLLRVMEAARGAARLAFDFLPSLSGVDYLDELEVVYHLYSYRHDHSAAIKSRCPPDDAHVPTVSHLWQTANWHEREAAGRRRGEGPARPPLPMDERARKIEMAQKKAVVIKKARDEARAKGLSGDDEKGGAQAALKAFEEEAAGAGEGAA